MKPKASKNHEFTLGRVLYDMAVVFIGVFVALLLDQHWEELKEQETTSESLSSIQQELLLNRDELIAKSEYHLRVSPLAFDALKSLEAGALYAEAPWLEGVKYPVVRTASFTTALQIGTFNQVSPALTATVNDAYQCFDQLSNLTNAYLPALAETKYNDGPRFFNIIGFATASLGSTEKNCIAKITVADAAIQQYLGE
ncbi:hypothetical protein [Kordiimonas sp. SCSIO 12610]|uniref:hypothetical protein n=1 Tax=Kordiimonas sp. SCSIO 12610 TaxID=2829597 RepID=UPI00210B6C1A|nr:hypothetical protein [Kordiimonas sp. SCSIO 12610]UTW56630.1 hypothetical protein KFF44_06965 [Kordiimonas sp. SCSIO 12610]